MAIYLIWRQLELLYFVSSTASNNVFSQLLKLWKGAFDIYYPTTQG